MANILIVEGDSRQVKSAIDQLGNEENSLTIFSCKNSEDVKELDLLVSMEMFDFILIGLLYDKTPYEDYTFVREIEVFKKAFHLLDRRVAEGVAFVGNPSNTDRFSEDVLSLFSRSYKFNFPIDSNSTYYSPVSSRRKSSELVNSLIMFNCMIDEYKYLLAPEGNRLKRAAFSLERIGDLCYNKGCVPERPWGKILETLKLPK